jgi:hypothetical protein
MRRGSLFGDQQEIAEEEEVPLLALNTLEERRSSQDYFKITSTARALLWKLQSEYLAKIVLSKMSML